MTDRGTPTPIEVADAGNTDSIKLARYDLLGWQQGVKGGRFIVEGLGVRVDEKGKTQAEIITYSPDSGLKVAPVAIRSIGRGNTVYQSSEAPEAAGLGSGVVR